jgi:hypothetical protein
MAIFRYRDILAFLLLIPGGSSGICIAKDIMELPIPDESHAALTVERGLSGVSSVDSALLVFPGKSQHMVKIPLDMKAKNRETKFGKMTDQTKIPLENSTYPGDWRGAYEAPDRIIVWDASLLQLLVLRAKDFKTVLSTTVPIDTLKPPADRMGEPTAREVTRTRERFRANSRKIFGSKFSGMAEMPAGWSKGDGRQFLLSTHIAEFPVLIMGCLKDDPATCRATRHCFLEGGPKRAADAVTGIGVVPGARELVIGDSGTNQIDVYKFNSCFDVVWKRTLRLPARLPKLSNVSVDSEGRLWVTTLVSDSFTDSNLLYWDKETWNP